MKRIVSCAATLLGAAMLTGCQTTERQADVGSAGLGYETATDARSVRAAWVDSRWEILSFGSDPVLGEESRHPNRATRELRTIPN